MVLIAGNRAKKTRIATHRVTYSAVSSVIVLAFAFGAVYLSNFAFADDTVVDFIGATVPVSCNMTSSGMDSHSVTMHNRSYVPNIGTSTMVVTCTDSAGFSIYAAGFTGEVVGDTNSTKLVGTEASDYATIETGTATSAGDPDVSNWAMKLASDSQAVYPVTILSDFDGYHVVPNEYTKVATRLAGTDAGPGATGSTITTTYAVYISGDQPSDIYSGKVKYILLHPNNVTP